MISDLDKINYIKKQFLCATPVKYFNSDNIIKDLNLDIQEAVLKETVNSELVRKYPISINYQKHFIKYFIDKLESQNSVVHDSWYEVYGRLVALVAPNGSHLNFKHYFFENSKIPFFKVITLKESNNLIGEGTTGLRTWQACLALSEWCLKNSESFHKKTVLELGSGIGLCSLTVALGCSPSNVIATDCHPSVLNVLCDNIEINSKVRQKSSLNCSCLLKTTINNCEIRVERLLWQEVDAEVCRKLKKIDYILAADVVYDQELFEPLISALKCLFENCQVDKAIFACTERNQETLGNFLDKIRESFTVSQLEIPEQDNFIWSTETPVKIFSFKLTHFR